MARTRVLSHGSTRDPGEVTFRTALFNAGAHSADHMQVVSPLAGFRRRNVFRVVLQWGPRLCCGRQNVLECARHDSDDRVRLIIEPDLLPDNSCVGTKPSPPQAIA